MKPAYVYRWLERVPDLLALARAQPAKFPYFLESAAGGQLGGHSLLFMTEGEALAYRIGDGPADSGRRTGFFERLECAYRAEALADDGPDDTQPRPPFIGGWFVYLGYEMAAEVEPTLNLPPNRTGLPDAIAHRCPAAIVVHHGAGRGEADRAVAVAESAPQLQRLLGLLNTAPRAAIGADPELAELQQEDPALFEAAVRRIHEYLRAGDVFQVNISRSWQGRFRAAPDPWRLYASLRHANPAPFAGLMRWGEDFLLSSSPERLVQVHGRTVQTRPIAGTRPRGLDDAQDRALSDELIGNLKERAEHVMLIDLERNDLGRVCRAGTVEVNELMVVETFAHVHHIVSNVRGELRAGASPVDAVKAVFPGGTITGCPKVRCMEIIAELEGEGRGFYTGSMGYLGRDGRMDLNILIRSMLVHGAEFRFRTGAGIVADSVPEQEVKETADKARGMLLAVESHGKENKIA
jgi:anthranilate synthase component 1